MSTIAQNLGQTAHLSPLLHKAKRLGLNSADDLLKLAVERGCKHYAPSDYRPGQVCEPGLAAFSDAELAIALISGAQRYDPLYIRCAAQLMGAPHMDPSAVCRLALMERCSTVLRHIARAGYENDKERTSFWGDILQRLPISQPVKAGILPHSSRFQSITGLVNPRHPGIPRAVWLRPAR